MSITLTRESYSAGPSLPFFVNSLMFEGQRVAFTVGTCFHEADEAERLCSLLNKLLENDAGQLIMDVKHVLAGTPSLVPPSPQSLIKFCVLSAIGLDVSPSVVMSSVYVGYTDEECDDAMHDSPSDEEDCLKILEKYSPEDGSFVEYLTNGFNNHWE